MHISKHNFKELESLILTLDSILFCQKAFCELDSDRLMIHFDTFRDSTCSNVDCMQSIVDDLKILHKCIADDKKFRF